MKNIWSRFDAKRELLYGFSERLTRLKNKYHGVEARKTNLGITVTWELLPGLSMVLLNRHNDLQMFLTPQNIDVYVISETDFTNLSHLKIQGFRVYHTIHLHNQAEEGVCYY